MAKTKPIGVRFDEDLLEVLREDEKCETAQQSLNFLSIFYRNNKKDRIDFIKKEPDLQKRKIEDITISIKDKHKLWKEGDPKEGSGSFFLKYNAMTYDEIENSKQ